MDKFTWDTTLMNSPNKVHVMYCGVMIVGYIYGIFGFNGFIYDVFMRDFDSHLWQHIGKFPTLAEAKAAVDVLAPLYWRDY